MEIKDNCPHCGDGFSIEVSTRTKVTCLTCRRNFSVLPDGEDITKEVLPLEILGSLLLLAKRDLGEYLSAVKRGYSVNEQTLDFSQKRVASLIEEMRR